MTETQDQAFVRRLREGYERSVVRRGLAVDPMTDEEQDDLAFLVLRLQESSDPEGAHKAFVRFLTWNKDLREALKRCCEIIENDVRQLRQEGFEGASWQLDAIRKARRFVETTDPLPDIGVTLEDR